MEAFKKIIIQFHIGELGDRNAMVNSNQVFAVNHNWRYLYLDRWPDDVRFKPNTKDPIILSEYLRFRLPLYYPNMIWVDTDCKLLHDWEMPENKPYFNQRQNGKLDYSIVASNNCTEFFETVLTKMQNVTPHYTCFAKALKDACVCNISPKCYYHAAYTYTALMLKRRQKKRYASV